MTRRTYKSKKDTGGVLDHKDMMSNMDEKDSVFDAFYIQNIKQTKREQSCMGTSNQYGTAPNRVRKRKYIKKVLKEVEPPPQESFSESVFLTPDKSIRVNKGPDLFDQLLNSPNVWSNVKQTKSKELYDKLLTATPKQAKTYVRKKVNYSSSNNSESDKENTDYKAENCTKNVTDIIAHKLVIEKEATPNQKIDESINNIVQKLSLINCISRRNSNSFEKRTFKHNRNRLTKNLTSPLLKTSPFSSTPLTEKERNKSIFKFSPIPMGDLEESFNYETVVDDDNEVNKSIVFIPKVINSALKKSKTQQLSPPDTQLHKNNVSEYKENKSKSIFSSDADSNNVSEYKENKSKFIFPSDAANHVSSPKMNSHSREACHSKDTTESNVQISSIQTSEMEPFLGFTCHSISNVYIGESSEEEKETSVIFSTKKTSKNSCRSKESVKSNNKNIQHDLQKDINYPKESVPLSADVRSTSLEPDVGVPENTIQNDESVTYAITEELTIPSQPFLGFSKIVTDNSDEEDLENASYCSRNSDKNDDFSDMTKNTTDSSKNSDSELHNSPQKITENDKHSSKSKDTFLHESNSSLDYPSAGHDSQSLYDTCNSETALHNDSIKEPVVAIERIMMDLSQKYCEMPYGDSDDEEANSKDHVSFENSYKENECLSANTNINTENFHTFTETDPNCNRKETSNIITEKDDSFTESDTDSEEKEIDSGNETTMYENRKSNEEERYVSFVTTRRRNEKLNHSLLHELSNNSSILVLDDSQESNSSEYYDMTVLSNKITFNSTKHVNNTLIQIDTERNSFETRNESSRENGMETVKNDIREGSPDATISNLTNNNSICFDKSDAHNSLDTTRTSDMKLGIVLQPGKKWERSLSIYRRMTTMNDHFDHSVLDAEDMHTKGRKYRQSVIETMEMQERSLLHNESIHSRRSTFVPKPSRSTIRIVKETNNSRISLSSTTVFDDLKGFLEDCDDTIVELSKLSLADDHDLTVVEQFHDSRVVTARDCVLRRCNQSDTIPFDECYPDTLLKNCRKIGEGVYGEVYLWRAPDGRARVMKIVPIAGHVKVNGEHQKDFHEIISEIVIAMELSALRAPIPEIECHFDEGKDIDALDLHAVENATDVFNEVLAVRCVYGSYPSRLLDLWELYDECKGSENDNPAFLPTDQQYLVLELANAGQDLESYQFNSADQAYALFLQVAFALAVGEESFQFEHRDLHWGNVLIAPSDQKYATFVLRGRAHRVPRRGVAATIIDYSLSRVSLPLGSRERDGESAALYNDLGTDESLFGAVGDYQFEVYRLMREKLGNDWKNFAPYTNILWLHYTVDKMITALRYKRTTTKTHKQYIAKLKGIKERILTYGSAAQFVLTDNEY